MDPVFLVMRLLHVCFGVFWVGVIVFAATMLMPSIRDTGPDGGKVMLALLRRGYMTSAPWRRWSRSGSASSSSGPTR